MFQFNVYRETIGSEAKFLNETENQFQKQEFAMYLNIQPSIKVQHTYLAASYCLTVNKVSSIVLLHKVFKLDVKKFKAPTKDNIMLMKN